MFRVITFYLLIILLTSSVTSGQTPTLKIDWEKRIITIDGKVVGPENSASGIFAAYSSVKRIAPTDSANIVLWIFDEIGITLVRDTLLGKNKAVYVSLSPSRGPSFDTSPKSFYSGRLILQGLALDISASISDIINQSHIPFEPTLPGGYWFSAENEQFLLTLTYRDKSGEKITNCYIDFR